MNACRNPLADERNIAQWFTLVNKVSGCGRGAITIYRSADKSQINTEAPDEMDVICAECDFFVIFVVIFCSINGYADRFWARRHCRGRGWVWEEGEGRRPILISDRIFFDQTMI